MNGVNDAGPAGLFFQQQLHLLTSENQGAFILCVKDVKSVFYKHGANGAAPTGALFPAEIAPPICCEMRAFISVCQRHKMCILRVRK